MCVKPSAAAWSLATCCSWELVGPEGGMVFLGDTRGLACASVVVPARGAHGNLL